MAIWIGADGSYTVAGNWDPANIPNDGVETAEFGDNSVSGAAAAIAITIDTAVGGFVFSADAPTHNLSLTGGAARTALDTYTPALLLAGVFCILAALLILTIGKKPSPTLEPATA